MAGVKGKSGRRPADNRATFNRFALEKLPEWLQRMETLSAGGDYNATRYLIEQAVGKAPQHVEVSAPEDDPLMLALNRVAAALGAADPEEEDASEEEDIIDVSFRVLLPEAGGPTSPEADSSDSSIEIEKGEP